jgi:hypothetical protein
MAFNFWSDTASSAEEENKLKHTELSEQNTKKVMMMPADAVSSGNVSNKMAPADAWHNFSAYRPDEGPTAGSTFTEFLQCVGGPVGCVNRYKYIKNS